MPDPLTPEFEERFARLFRLAESLNRKVDSLSDGLVEVSKRLDSIEERLISLAVDEPEVAEKMSQLSQEIETEEQERASLRQSSNMVSLGELSALFGK